MAGDGGDQIVLFHAAAVVGHPDEGDAAPLDLQGDLRRAGVHRVFQKLLDGGGGAVHHLARRDEVGDLKG